MPTYQLKTWLKQLINTKVRLEPIKETSEKLWCREHYFCMVQLIASVKIALLVNYSLKCSTVKKSFFYLKEKQKPLLLLKRNKKQKEKKESF